MLQVKMRLLALLLLPVAALAVDDIVIGSRDGGVKCPAVWNKIATDLRTLFLDTSNGQCNDDARAAIREAFHDCGTWDSSQGSKGGCDGSLILSQAPNAELDRGENGGLKPISAKLWDLQKKYSTTAVPVTVADMIQFAASIAIVTCPGGPQVKTYVGRKDSATPAPNGGLPDVHASADSLYALFQAKGFTANELAALLGAHSTSRQFGVDTSPENAGLPQDSTPGMWDVKFYGDTLAPPSGVYVLPSDKVLAAHATVGKEFKGFVGNQGKWTSAFASAMSKMSLLGVPGGKNNLIDCTDYVPKGTNNKREMRAAPINDRIR